MKLLCVSTRLFSYFFHIQIVLHTGYMCKNPSFMSTIVKVNKILQLEYFRTSTNENLQQQLMLPLYVQIEAFTSNSSGATNQHLTFLSHQSQTTMSQTVQYTKCYAGQHHCPVQVNDMCSSGMRYNLSKTMNLYKTAKKFNQHLLTACLGKKL